VRHLICIIKF